MNNKTTLVDNINENKLFKVLNEIYSNLNSAESVEVRIASAFFSPEGFSKISDYLVKLPKVRLMLGVEPPLNNERWHKKLDESPESFNKRQLKENLKNQEKYIKQERDHYPFNKASSKSIKSMVEALKSGNIQVKRYEESFMHAKAYILSIPNNNSQSVIVGSSNLTSSGLANNLELNMKNSDDEVIKYAEVWFDSLWEKAIDFDLANYFEEIFIPRQPIEIFLRVLWELYGDEINDDLKQDKNLPLTSFQKHGVERALRLIDQCGGVIVADEVGLGKTFIAGEILTRYMNKRQRALLICPAALRDSTSKKFKSDYQLYVEVLSFEQLANDEQLMDAKRPLADQKHIERNIEEYQLIIVDEAHNYRNPEAPYRAGVLRSLLYHNPRKDLLMLTATPVNNSLWDLFHLTRFFIRQDSFLANKGIISIRERFEEAMRYDPANLSPDLLYPIIDATTVKRTRQFVKKHYPNDLIRGSDGNMVPIIFPKPTAITVRYDLDESYPDLFDLIESALDPESDEQLTFARYKTEIYRIKPDQDEERRASAAIGLIRSGLLKRFESSGEAFRKTINRLIDQHNKFIKAIYSGKIITTAFLNELSITDDDEFEEMLNDSEYTFSTSDYDIQRLKEDIEKDLNLLIKIEKKLKNIAPQNDPKLKALVKEIEKICQDAENEAIDSIDETQKRKVLIFSYFSDTVGWIRDYLIEEVKTNAILNCYQNRIASVSGTPDELDIKREAAVEQFAPISSGASKPDDLIDILISTDVLAEGVNLQQCRNIINYDMPWNPMRLVQRHGRIDRIGSPHSRVFMRTIFPSDRLDELLNLESRIIRKLAMAAASVGVSSPLDGVESSNHVFSETREEIEKLLKEDATLFERGGTASSAQTGEEYRQTLRKAIENNKDLITNIPWKSGSGMISGEHQGYFFCSKVGERTYLKFIHTDDNWVPKTDSSGYLFDQYRDNYSIISEIGTCLRIIECTNETPLHIEETATSNVFDSWEIVKKDIWNNWMHETDPANLQPKVRPLNQKVASFIRENIPSDIDIDRLNKSLDILESPWPRRDENLLRSWFETDLNNQEKSRFLIESIIQSGLLPSQPIEPLPPILEDDIELLVWIAIKSNKSN